MLWLIFTFLTLGGCSAGTLREDKLSIVDIDTSSLPEVNSRIIGGSATTIDQYPYTVQIIANNNLRCAGTLLTTRIVLTAAHCFVDDRGEVYDPRLFTVRAGTTDNNSGGVTSAISAVEVHQMYDEPAHDNDVAILVLASPFTYSANIASASIPKQGSVVADNSTLIHVGWGRTNAAVEQSVSPVLLEVAVRKVNWQTCATRYSILALLENIDITVTSNMMCAGLLDVGGADACQGDSGGPLIYSDVVVGITSWGYGCAHPTYPGVNARVASYTDWIEATVAKYNAASSMSESRFIVILAVSFILRSFIN